MGGDFLRYPSPRCVRCEPRLCDYAAQGARSISGFRHTLLRRLRAAWLGIHCAHPLPHRAAAALLRRPDPGAFPAESVTAMTCTSCPQTCRERCAQRTRPCGACRCPNGCSCLPWLTCISFVLASTRTRWLLLPLFLPSQHSCFRSRRGSRLCHGSRRLSGTALALGARALFLLASACVSALGGGSCRAALGFVAMSVVPPGLAPNASSVFFCAPGFRMCRFALRRLTKRLLECVCRRSCG